jgi:hypothetical protein
LRLGILGILLVLTQITTQITEAEDLQADLYGLKAGSSVPEFHFVRKDTVQDGHLRRESLFKDAKEQIAVSEVMVFSGTDEGTPILSTETSQNQTQVSVKVQRKARTGEADRYEIDVLEKGEHRIESFQVKPDLILPPQLLMIMVKNWDLWEQKKDLNFRLLIPDLRQTLSMEISRVEDSSRPEVVRLKMRPSNFAISAFVDPLYFEFDKNTKAILKAEGRTLLIDQDKNPFIARTVFKRETPAASAK